MTDSVSRSTIAPGPKVVITWLGRTSPIDFLLIVRSPLALKRTLPWAQPREGILERPIHLRLDSLLFAEEHGCYSAVECQTTARNTSRRNYRVDPIHLNK